MYRNIQKDSYLDDFQKSLNTLEDIQLLSEFSLSPLIGQAYFHLSEMKRKADVNTNRTGVYYSAISKVLDEKFESIITDFFSNKSKFKDFDFKKSTSKIDLKKWNLIFEIIPEVLSVVSLFNYHGTIEARLDEGKLVISGQIFEENYQNMNRKFIYVITRKLLREKVLLTFSLEKTARAGLLKLDLKVDISHDESLIYKVSFKPSKNEKYLVGFSNVFCQYRTLIENINHVGEHNIIEIESDLNVKHILGLPDLTRMESANKEILHFPFIFRPVSIILPIKGNLSGDSFFRNLAISKDGQPMREQDVSTYYRKIDFFSLFNS